MEFYDSNIIKPVEGLDNVIGIAAVRRREERRRKQQSNKNNSNKPTEQSPEPVVPDKYDSDRDGIDYIA